MSTDCINSTQSDKSKVSIFFASTKILSLKKLSLVMMSFVVLSMMTAVSISYAQTIPPADYCQLVNATEPKECMPSVLQLLLCTKQI